MALLVCWFEQWGVCSVEDFGMALALKPRKGCLPSGVAWPCALGIMEGRCKLAPSGCCLCGVGEQFEGVCSAVTSGCACR